MDQQSHRGAGAKTGRKERPLPESRLLGLVVRSRPAEFRQPVADLGPNLRSGSVAERDDQVRPVRNVAGRVQDGTDSVREMLFRRAAASRGTGIHRNRTRKRSQP